MERRDFVRLAIAAGLAPWLGELAFSQVGTTIRVRKSATTLAASMDIDTLRSAVATLAANTTATDYKSWMYWANSHGTPDDIPASMAAVWYQCQHSNAQVAEHFLSWHRAYLFFFEALVRELTQVDTFALPYWDWYTNSAVPPAFDQPMVGGNPNALYHGKRAYRTRTLVRTALTEPKFDDFQALLEGNPHGTIHVMVRGDMGSVETSARDPVFWAHHGNIDRMWEVWLAADPARRNPSTPDWLSRRFAFDTQGNNALTVSQLLRTAVDLGYVYDSVTAEAHPEVVPNQPKKAIKVPRSPFASVLKGAKVFTGTVTVSGPTQVDLRGGSLTLDFAVPRSAAGHIELLSVPEKNEGDAVVVFEGVTATPEGLSQGADYRIYVNLPEKSNPSLRHEDFYIGSINTFSLSHHRDHPRELRFHLGERAAALAKLGLWKPGELSVSFVSDDTDGATALIKIQGVRLEFVGQAIR